MNTAIEAETLAAEEACLVESLLHQILEVIQEKCHLVELASQAK